MMLKEIMKEMNKLHRNHTTEINKSDVKNLFGNDLEMVIKCFDILGIEYDMVADLLNVTVKYFTRDEQKRIIMNAKILGWI